MITTTLHIQASVPYPIYLGQGLLHDSELLTYCQSFNKRWVMITDHQVEPLARALQTHLNTHGLPVELLSFPAGEIHKTRETKHHLEDQLLKKGYGRDTSLIAVGGGMVTDLVGFLAATYCRGIPCIYIPTTLLGMVDASIGGKTGVNTPYGKNLIGCFSQPTAVFMDIETLSTLPTQEWTNGIAELVKHGLIADEALFQLLKKSVGKLSEDSSLLLQIIDRSCRIKQKIVEADERESSQRQLLNAGHTIGHAIETLEEYHISHGEAVAIGLLVEAHLSVQLGLLSEAVLTEVEDLLKAYQFRLKTRAFQDKTAFLKTLVLDKKSFSGEPRFVLLEKIGQPFREGNAYVFPVESSVLSASLDWATTPFFSQ